MNIDYKKLKEKYQTPLYVYDQNKIEEIMDEYINNFRSDKFNTKVLYASKAFSVLYIYKLCKKHGLLADVVSGGEIYTALTSGFDPSSLYFHGNNKTEDEIIYALENDISHFVIDSVDDFELLQTFVCKLKKKVYILLRLNVGVEAHTHKYDVTAHVDSKFGLQMDDKILNPIIEKIDNSEYMILEGFHAHIGSQIFEYNGYDLTIDKLFNYVKKINRKVSINLGGGFGVKYTNIDHPLTIEQTCKHIIKYAENKIEELNINIDTLLIEPGRSIVAEAGSTLYTVGSLKETPHRKYYFIDGGMSDNIRPALYQAKYEADIITNMDAKKDNLVTVAGKCCESGDIIIEDINLQEAKRGDLMVVYTTGAYGYSMASNYNKALRPAVVFVKDGVDHLVCKRQTFEDIIRGEVFEDF